jgi:hypothetical protein
MTHAHSGSGGGSSGGAVAGAANHLPPYQVMVFIERYQ